MEIKYIKSAARVLDRDCVNRAGLDLFKEVLWVSVDQRAAEILAVKVGDQKIILPLGLALAKQVQTGRSGRILFDFQL